MQKIINGLILFLLVFQFTHLKAEVKPTFVRSADTTNVNQAIGVTLTPDGTRIHFSQYGTSPVITQYDLSIPFNVSSIDTASIVTLNVNSGDSGDFLVSNRLEGHTFNSDGTKLYAIDMAGNMNVHSLSTPYDISNFSKDADDGVDWATFAAGEGGSDSARRSHGIRFNNDGTKMFLMDVNGTVGIAEFNLSTPFLPGSASFGNFFAITENSATIQDFDFDDDGTRMYVIESNEASTNNKIYVYKLSTGFDTSTATFVGSVANVFSAAGADGSAGGMRFAKNGMKFYQVTWASTLKNKVFEYDLSCPFGIVICEADVATAIGAQAEIAKNIIYQNSNTIFKRFDWLRRNEEKRNLNSHNIKLDINNPILASFKHKLENSLKHNLENSLNNNQFIHASLKDKNPFKNMRNWSHWSHVDISFGRVGEKGFIKPKDIRTRGIMFGADKLIDNKIFGLAFRYGNDDVKIDTGLGSKLDAQAYTLNMYGSLPLDGKSNLNTLIGASFLSIDQLVKNTVTGERYGRQIFTSMIYENENEYTRHNLTPFGKFEIGITQLSEYTDFGTSATNSVDVHERLTFKTGNASGGFKFDDTVYLDNKTLNRNGFVEYIFDLTPDIDHFYKNHIDNTTVRKTIKKHSLHNIRGNIGFEYMNVNGYTFAINYERFQSLSNSAYSDSLLFKLGKKQVNQANFDVIYDPTNNNNTEISYLKNFGNFKLKIDSNYSLFSKIPDYGANLEISGTF
jgi:hypothetical protein